MRSCLWRNRSSSNDRKIPSNLNCRGLGKRHSRTLTADDQFAKVIPRKKKLHRRCALEELFQAPIVEILTFLVNSTGPWRLQESLPVLDPVVIDRDRRRFLVRAEEKKQMCPRPQNPKELRDRLLDQRRSQKLEGVPDKHRVKGSFRERETLVEKSLRVAGGLLAS